MLQKYLWRFFAAILLTLNIWWIYQTLQYNQYHDPLGKITKIETSNKQDTIDEHQNKDVLTTQKIELIVLSSQYKGKKLTLSNTFSQSKIKDQDYKKGELVFLSIKDSNMSQTTILDTKRDTGLAIMMFCFVLLLILIGRKNGVTSLLGLIINTGLFYCLLIIYEQISSQSLVWLCLLFFPIIVSSTLIISNGWNQKTKIAILATICSTLVTFIVGVGVITLLKHKGLRYEEMELITRPQHVLFISSLLIGTMGATMDISITLSTAMNEIGQRHKQLPPQALYQSGIQVGSDVIGPMINIMFFSYLSGSIPLILIFLRNDMSFNYTFPISLSLEVTRALIGSIGIILTIPITSFIASIFLTRRNEHEC